VPGVLKVEGLKVEGCKLKVESSERAAGVGACYLCELNGSDFNLNVLFG
jgi:hypothetical protein